MRKKKIKVLLFILLFTLLLIPRGKANAMEVVDYDEHEDDLVLLSSNTKYYKVITTYNNSSLNSLNVFGEFLEPTSQVIEITYEEYMNFDPNNSIVVNESHTVEYAYMFITSYLFQNGSYYRYKNLVNWKSFPSYRGNDIIGIGFYNTVTPVSSAFQQEYCSYSQGCGTASFHLTGTFSEGISAVFPMVVYNDLYSLSSMLYVDVEKTNPNSTVTLQLSSADYAHATSEVALATAFALHNVAQDVSIILNSNISSKYYSPSDVSILWHGSW